MSDFLTRLAERELGLSARVKPWIAPRFAEGPELAASFDLDGPMTASAPSPGGAASPAGPSPELLAMLPPLRGSGVKGVDARGVDASDAGSEGAPGRR